MALARGFSGETDGASPDLSELSGGGGGGSVGATREEPVGSGDTLRTGDGVPFGLAGIDLVGSGVGNGVSPAPSTEEDTDNVKEPKAP